MGDVTRILAEIENGDAQAAAQLLPLVYDELRKFAASQMARETPGQTLQPTALVHEAYVRLVDGDGGRLWDSRRHFFAAAAEAMRRILIERARQKATVKHGGGLVRREIDPDAIAVDEVPFDVLELDDALERLTTADPQAAQLVKLRYFAGLSIPKAAEILGVSPRTADDWWAYAKAWLVADLRSEAD